MICVTGAGGVLGAAVVAELAASRAAFRTTWSTPERADAARRRGLDAMFVDYRRPDTMSEAFQGCSSVFLLAPNDPDQTQLELNIAGAAKLAGVSRIVKQSVIGVDDAYSLGEVHSPVERAIVEQGFAWTFLQPNSFMQNVVTYMGATIRAEDTFYSASGEAQISHIDVRDIAAAAVQALTDSRHEGQAYRLTGPQALSYDELATRLTTVLGRNIQHVSLAPDVYRESLISEGLPEIIADRMVDLERYFREGRAAVVTDDLRQVLGRAPRNFAAYLAECAPLLQQSRSS